jgi:ATP-binding cassette subfamily B (MDR/TAP) protein 1
MGWFTKKKNADSGDPEKLVDEDKSITDTQASTTDTVIDVKQPEKEANPPSVAFFAMFRFATKLETTLNILALFSAAAAGAAQPLMSLIFGNLTQSFVSFGQAAMNQAQHPSDMGAEGLKQAAASFRHEASKDALLLVVIGKCICAAPAN